MRAHIRSHDDTFRRIACESVPAGCAAGFRPLLPITSHTAHLRFRFQNGENRRSSLARRPSRYVHGGDADAAVCSRRSNVVLPRTGRQLSVACAAPLCAGQSRCGSANVRRRWRSERESRAHFPLECSAAAVAQGVPSLQVGMPVGRGARAAVLDAQRRWRTASCGQRRAVVSEVPVRGVGDGSSFWWILVVWTRTTRCFSLHLGRH